MGRREGQLIKREQLNKNKEALTLHSVHNWELGA